MTTTNESTNAKLENFIFKNRKAIISAAAIVCAAALVICVFVGVKDSKAKKGLEALDKIEFAFTSKSFDITDEEVAARQEKALADVAAYCSMGGIVGVRANYLAADIYFEKKDYASALDSYVLAASKGKKTYVSPICSFNAGVCCEELGKNEDAMKYFAEASEADDFYLAAHALFNVGRIQESLDKVDEAYATYKKIVDSYTNDSWANLAQSRIIDLQAKGKVE